MDLFNDPSEKDKVSPFVKLLWERGALYESEVVGNLKLPFVDFSSSTGDEKERLTREAMERGEPLIYSGRVSAADLLGEPDLLRKEGTRYIAGDIKSGAGEEGPEDDPKPKPHYAVQLGLYTDILEKLKLSAGRRAFVWDIHGQEVIYDFMTSYGVRTPRTLWQDYEKVLSVVRAILQRTEATLAAYATSECKLCHWHTICLKRLEEANDLTLIPGLGRSKRDSMYAQVATIQDLANCNVDKFITGKKTIFPGIGPDSIKKFHARAQLLTHSGKPYLREPISLPHTNKEVFFDIEHDPFGEVCYLHGFIEREGETERYIAFFVDEATLAGEGEAFAKAWDYMKAAKPCLIYYYSKYERSAYRKLRERHPHVCTEVELESLFDQAQSIDLYYDVVLKATEWPTRDFSLKTIAKYLGFKWRDPDPSGAASIEWFHRWRQDRDPEIKQRILDYNEDDCRATMVLLDGIRNLTS